jgi:hypothetical protein
MTFSASGSVSFGSADFSSRFSIDHGKPSFDFKLGAGKDDEAVRGASTHGACEAHEEASARSEQFLEDVKAVKDSSSKRALIDNFVKDAIKENRAAEKQAASDDAKPTKAADAGKAEGAKAAEGKKADGELGFAPVMKELQGLAETIDKSKLPEKTQGKLLDGVAELASDLKQAQADGGDLRETALNGLADLAKTLDESKGGEKAKGEVMDKIADSLTKVATGGADKAEDQACGCGEKAASGEGTASTRAAEESSDAPWSHSVKDGKAEINLGDKYTITADEGEAAWTVKNNETGATTRVSGDPHVDVGADGKNDWDFKKDMSFQLDDGT